MNITNLIHASMLNERILSGKDSTTGRVVRRYNIPMAKIEFYHIPFENLNDYELAKSKQDLSANNKYGIQVQF